MKSISKLLLSVFGPLLLCASAMAQAHGVSGLTVSPASVLPGQPVTITATLSNPGHNPSGQLTIRVTRPNGGVTYHNFSFNSGNMGTRTLSFTPTTSGTHTVDAKVDGNYFNNNYDYLQQSFSGQWRLPQTFNVLDVTAPAAPGVPTTSNVAATSFQINWTKPTDDTGVTGYQIWREDTNGADHYFDYNSTAASLSYALTGLTQGTTYGVRIKARDAAGNWSGWSGVRAQQTLDTSPPVVPGPAICGFMDSAVFICWSRPGDNVGTTGYEIRREDPSGAINTTSYSSNAASPSYTVGGLTQGATYLIQVRARDAAGNWSGWSAPLPYHCPDITPPPVPGVPTASNVTPSSFQINWTKPTDNVGVTGYQIWREDPNGADHYFDYNSTAASLSYALTGLTSGATYAVRTKARDAAGNWSGWSGVLTQQTIDNQIPAPPPIIAPPPSPIPETSFTITWSASSDNVAVTGYLVYMNGSLATTKTSTSHTFGSLSPWTTYTVRVDARDAAGNTATGPSVSIKTGDHTPPAAPALPIVESVLCDGFTVKWNKPADNVGVVGYQLSVTRPGWSDLSLIEDLGAPPSKALTNLAKNVVYTIKVQAKDAAGNWSGWSSERTLNLTDTTPPTTPTNVTFSAVNQYDFEVAWGLSQDTCGVVAYDIVATPTGGGVAVSDTATSSPLTLEDLIPHTEYSVVVIARDARNNASPPSQPKLQTTADTGCPHQPKGLLAKNKTETGFTVDWTECFCPSPVTSTFEIAIGPKGASEEQLDVLATGIPETAAVNGVLSYDVTGRQPWTEYDVYVTSTSSNPEKEPVTANLTLRTDDVTPPTLPSSFAVSAKTETSFTLHWAPSSDAASGVKHYQVYKGAGLCINPQTQQSYTTGTSMAISGMAPWTEYAMKVVAFDNNDNDSEFVATFRTDDTHAPTAPTNLRVDAGSLAENSFVLRWDASTDNVAVVGYDVYKNNVLYASVSQSTLSATIQGLAPWTQYDMKVVARDAKPNSAESATISPRTDDTHAPTAPSNLQVSSVTETSFALSWNASSDNVAVVGYEVRVDGALAKTVTGTSATINQGLAPWTEYDVTVVAMDAKPNKTASPAIEVRTDDATKPTAPSNLRIGSGSLAESSFVLRWNASSDNVGVVGYDIYKDGGQPYASVSGGVLSATIEGLAPWTNYSMTVVARDAKPNASDPSAAFVARTDDATPPTPPTNLEATGITDTGFTLSWSASTDAIGVDGYDVYKGGTLYASIPATALSASVSGLSPWTSYAMTVVARDAKPNASDPSEPLEVRTRDNIKPSPPPSALSESNVTETGFTLSWSASSDNAGPPLYDVYIDGELSVTVTGPATSASVSGLAPWTSYLASVTARDEAGNIAPSVSTLAVKTSDVTKPSAPAAPSAGAVESGSITAVWSRPNDNVGVVRYDVWIEAPDGADAYEVVHSTNASASCELGGLVPGLVYQIRVRAWDEAGNDSLWSAPLSQQTIDTNDPTTPEDVIVYVSDTFCRIDWSAAQDDVGIAGYQVKFDGAIVSVAADRLNRQFDQLAKGSTHTLAVRSVDGAGNVSDWSETHTIKTHSFTDGRGVAEVVVTPKVVTNGEVVTIAVVMADSAIGGYYKNGSLSVSVRNPMGSSSGFSYQYLQFPAYLDGEDPNYSPDNPSVHKFTYTPHYDGEYHASAKLTATKYSESVPMSGLTTSEFPDIGGYPDTFVFNDMIPAPPTVPTGLEAFSIGTRAFGLRWKESYDAQGVDGYEARIVDGGSSYVRGTSSFFNYLEAQTPYVAQVRSKDADGNWSAWSAPLALTTASYPANDLDGDGIPNAADADPNDAANALEASPGDPNRSQYDAYYYSEHASAFRKAEASRSLTWVFGVGGTGTGKVTITAGGKTGEYNIESSQGKWMNEDIHPGLELQEGEEVTVAVQATGVSDYTVKLLPWNKGHDDWKSMRVLYNGEPRDGILKSSISGGQFQLGVDVSARVPFAMLDSSDIESRRQLRLGMGTNFRGRSSGYLTIALGPYGYEFADIERNRATIDFLRGIGASSLETPDRIQAKAPSGWMDAQFSSEDTRLDVRFYEPDGVALGSVFRDMSSATLMAHYRLDLAEPSIAPTSESSLSLRQRQNLRVQRDIGGVAHVYEVKIDRSGSRMVTVGNASPDGYPTQLTTDTLSSFAHVAPWREPLASKIQWIAYNYSHTEAKHVSGTFSGDVSGTPYLHRQVLERDGGISRVLSLTSQMFPQGDRYLQGRPDATYRQVGLDRQRVSYWRNAEMDGKLDYFKRNNELETTRDGALIFRELYRPQYSRVIGWLGGAAVPGVIEEGNMDGQPTLAEGKIREERRSFLDSEALGGATDIVTHFTYHPTMYDGEVRVKDKTVSQAGQEIGKTTYSYTDNTYFGGKKVFNTTRTEYASSGSSLTTTVRSYGASVASEDLKGRILLVSRPDATRSSYAYQRGTLDLATGNWSSATGGSHFLSAELFGKSGSGVSKFVPLGGGQIAVEPLDMQARRSTVSERIIDNRGNAIREASYVYNGGTAYVLLSAVYHTYDAFGHLLETANAPASDPARAVLYSAEYNGLQKTREVDAQGIVTLYDYDELGRVALIEKEGVSGEASIVTGFAYDGANRLTERVDGVGAAGAEMVTTFKYDMEGRVTERQDPGVFYPTTYAYDTAANPRATVVTLPTGATKIAARYRDGRPKSVSGTGAVAETYGYEYTATGQLKTTRALTATGQSTSTYSDWLGRTVQADEPTFDGSGRQTFSTYNTKGQLARVEVKSGAEHLLPRTIYEYDFYARLERVGSDSEDDDYSSLNPLNLGTDMNIVRYFSEYKEVEPGKWFLFESQYDYPFPGNSTQRLLGNQYTQITGLPANRLSYSYGHDLFGNRTETKVEVDRATRSSAATTTVFGAPDATTGSPVAVGSPLVTTSVNGLLRSSSNAQGHVTTHEYDAVGRLWKEHGSRLSAPTVYQYLSNTPFLQSVTAPDGARVHYNYDAKGRLAWQYVGAPGATAQYARYEYDLLGNVTETWGNAATPTRYTYDALGRPKTLRTYRAEAGWGAASKPAAFADNAQGDVTTWTYQPSTGLLLSKEDAAGKKHEYTYDDAGRVLTRKDARGAVTTYHYRKQAHASSWLFIDALWKIDYPDAAIHPGTDSEIPATPDVQFVHHRNGQYKNVIDSTGTRTFSYYDINSASPLGPLCYLMQEKLGASNQGRDINFSFNMDTPGQLKGERMKYSYDGVSLDHHVAYSHGDAGRLDSVRPGEPTDPAFQYAYVPGSNLVASVERDAFKRAYGYEASSNRLSTLDHLDNGVPKSQIQVAYDPIGRKAQERHWGEAPTALALPTGYATDYHYNSTLTSLDPHPEIDRNELIVTGKRLLNGSSAGPGWTVGSTPVEGTARGYTYDAIGSRTLADVGYVANSLNQYSSVGSQAYAYDENGNLKSDGSRIYYYDAENRLAKIKQGTDVFEYTYDYLGRRASKKKNGGSEIRFVYDGWNLVAETDSSGNVQRRFTWGLDASGTLQGAGGVGGLLMIEDGTQAYYPIYDSGHNVVALRDQSGSVVAAYDYDAFGSETARAGSYADNNPFRFSTKYTDEETGLVYYGMRFYSPELGRFINRDPIGESGGLNLYGFVGNDPANQYDVLGMRGEEAQDQAYRLAARREAERQHGSVFDALRSGSYLSWSNTYRNSYLQSWNTFTSSGSPTADSGLPPDSVGHGRSVFVRTGEDEEGEFNELSVYTVYGSEESKQKDLARKRTRSEDVISFGFNAFINGNRGDWLAEPGDLINQYVTQWWQFKTDVRDFGEFSLADGNARLFTVGAIHAADIGNLNSDNVLVFSQPGDSHQRHYDPQLKRWFYRTARANLDVNDVVIRNLNNDASIITITASAGYPFIEVAPNIDYRVNFAFVRVGDSVSVLFSATHNRFPDYEGFVNGVQIYERLSSSSGPNSINLNTRTYTGVRELEGGGN